MVFLLISVGPLLFLLNRSYSIVDMTWLADHTGEYDRLFWAVATFWTVELPIAERAGLPLGQPVLPWIKIGFSLRSSFVAVARGSSIGQQEPHCVLPPPTAKPPASLAAARWHPRRAYQAGITTIADERPGASWRMRVAATGLAIGRV
ncbi:MAG TPA: hypothetical protein VFU22_07605 [Roseiflexaceae bacterium]|nr:hypothetical protein [Roseiflexaceae bacterium]